MRLLLDYGWLRQGIYQGVDAGAGKSGRIYGTVTVVCPGLTTEIFPAHVHINEEPWFRAGWLPINTVGEPGTHGLVVTGMQGCGVNTPCAAAVAALTAGLAIEVHMPKGMMFTFGLKSIMLAAGWPPAVTRFSGVTTRLLGMAPKIHWSCAPLTTNGWGMLYLPARIGSLDLERS
jgi:hypothetical protein